MSGIAQRQMLKQQDRETAANIMKQAAANREASGRVGKTIENLQQSGPESDVAARRSAYTSALQRTQPANAALPGVAGTGGSRRFAEDVSAAREGAAVAGADEADSLANIEAPMLQRQREAQDAAGTASDLSLIQNRASGQDFLSKLRLSAIRPNAALSAGGQLLSGFGSATAAKGGESGSGSVWKDGTASSGLTAQQRRMKWLSTPGIGDGVH